MNRTRCGRRRRLRRRVGFSKLFWEGVGYTSENGEISEASQTTRACNNIEIPAEHKRKVARSEAKSTERASTPHIMSAMCKPTGKVTGKAQSNSVVIFLCAYEQ